MANFSQPLHLSLIRDGKVISYAWLIYYYNGIIQGISFKLKIQTQGGRKWLIRLSLTSAFRVVAARTHVLQRQLPKAIPTPSMPRSAWTAVFALPSARTKQSQLSDSLYRRVSSSSAVSIRDISRVGSVGSEDRRSA